MTYSATIPLVRTPLDYSVFAPRWQFFFGDSRCLEYCSHLFRASHDATRRRIRNGVCLERDHLGRKRRLRNWKMDYGVDVRAWFEKTMPTSPGVDDHVTLAEVTDQRHSEVSEFGQASGRPVWLGGAGHVQPHGTSATD